MEKLHIDESISYNLKKAAGWIKFLSILNYIFMGIAIFFGVIGFIMSIVTMMQPYGSEAGAVGLILSLIYGVVGSLLTFFPARYGMGFNNKINDALMHGNQESMQKAFSSLGSWFKFYGIFMIVYLVIIFLYIIIGIVMFSSSSVL